MKTGGIDQEARLHVIGTVHNSVATCSQQTCIRFDKPIIMDINLISGFSFRSYLAPIPLSQFPIQVYRGSLAL